MEKLRKYFLFRKNGLAELLLVSLLICLCYIPFVYSMEDSNGTFLAKQFYFYQIMAFILAYSAFYFLLKKHSIKTTFRIADIWLILFWIYISFRAVFTSQIPILHNTTYINYTLGIALYFIVKQVNSEIGKEGKSEGVPYGSNFTVRKTLSLLHFFTFSLICFAFAQAVYGLLQLYGYYPSFNSNFQITGTFYNPAPYALYLAAIYPLALWGILFPTKNTENFFSKYFNKFYQIFCYLTLLAILLVLPPTLIRASWLMVIISSLFILNLKYRFLHQLKNWIQEPSKKILVGLVVLFVLSLGVTGIYSLKKASSNGKLLIWEVTLNQITKKPLFGAGMGRFEAEYNNWQAEYFVQHPAEQTTTKGLVAGNTKYAFNEFLQMTSEVGIIGLVLFVAFTVSLLSEKVKEFFVFAGLVESKEVKEVKEVKIVKGVKQVKAAFTFSFLHFLTFKSSLFNSFTFSFLSLLVACCISFPFYSLPTFILFFVFAGLIESKEVKEVKAAFTFSLFHFFIFTSFLSLAVFSFSLSKNSSVYKQHNEANLLYNYGDYHEANLAYSKIYSEMRYNGEFLQTYGKSLQMAGYNNAAIYILQQATELTTDHVLWCTLGDAYKATQRYASAEAAYMHASVMVPHLLYPNYLLAKLYHASGQTQKAKTKAREVLEMNAKIESEAVVEMKEEMKKIMEDLPVIILPCI